MTAVFIPMALRGWGFGVGGMGGWRQRGFFIFAAVSASVGCLRALPYGL